MKKILFTTLICTLIYVGCKSAQPINKGADIEDISYNRHIKLIISDNCISCHSGTVPCADMGLDSYEKLVKAVKTRGLLKRINNYSDPMPTSGLMPKDKRLLIQKWVENNFAKDSEIGVNEPIATTGDSTFNAPQLTAINIEEKGFEFLEKMQGHWVGKMFLLGQSLPWFTFDFRAINSSQVHGLFEGGSMGNLFNTFFIAEYKNVKTIMLRNGGILSGIYRTSYFVLTEINGHEYVFEDAYGGKKIMSVKISFNKNKMKMLTYTSKFGAQKASRHMEFEGKRMNVDLYQRAAKKFNFPSKEIVKSFPDGMPLPNWGKEYPYVTSASYIMAMDKSTDYVTLGKWAKDPIQITDIENIAELELDFKRTDLSKGKNISVYLSYEPLTEDSGKMKMEYGYISEHVMNQVILFPEIDKNDDRFTMMYLHTGKCYVTFVIDNDSNLIPSKGDYYSESIEVNLSSEKRTIITVDNIVQTM